MLKSANLSADAIKAGKNQLKLQVLTEAEEGTALAESIASQGLYTGVAKSPLDIANEIDSLSNNDISQVKLFAIQCMNDTVHKLVLSFTLYIFHWLFYNYLIFRLFQMQQRTRCPWVQQETLHLFLMLMNYKLLIGINRLAGNKIKQLQS